MNVLRRQNYHGAVNQESFTGKAVGWIDWNGHERTFCGE